MAYPLTLYHVFTNSHDEWTANYSEALAIYQDLIKDHACARLYAETYTDETAYENSEPNNEECLQSFGSWPL